MKALKYVFICLGCVVLFSQCKSQREKDYEQITEFEKRLINNKSTTIQEDKADSIIMLYDNYAKHYVDDSLAPDYLLRAADVAIQIKNGNKAIGFFDRLINNYPDHKIIPVALYYEAVCYNEILRDSTKAKEACLVFLEKYPNHPMKPDVENLQRVIGLSDTQLMDMILRKSQAQGASNQ